MRDTSTIVDDLWAALTRTYRQSSHCLLVPPSLEQDREGSSNGFIILIPVVWILYSYVVDKTMTSGSTIPPVSLPQPGFQYLRCTWSLMEQVHVVIGPYSTSAQEKKKRRGTITRWWHKPTCWTRWQFQIWKQSQLRSENPQFQTSYVSLSLLSLSFSCYKLEASHTEFLMSPLAWNFIYLCDFPSCTVSLSVSRRSHTPRKLPMGLRWVSKPRCSKRVRGIGCHHRYMGKLAAADQAVVSLSPHATFRILLWIRSRPLASSYTLTECVEDVERFFFK